MAVYLCTLPWSTASSVWRTTAHHRAASDIDGILAKPQAKAMQTIRSAPHVTLSRALVLSAALLPLLLLPPTPAWAPGEAQLSGRGKPVFCLRRLCQRCVKYSILHPDKKVCYKCGRIPDCKDRFQKIKRVPRL